MNEIPDLHFINEALHVLSSLAPGTRKELLQLTFGWDAELVPRVVALFITLQILHWDTEDEVSVVVKDCLGNCLGLLATFSDSSIHWRSCLLEQRSILPALLRLLQHPIAPPIEPHDTQVDTPEEPESSSKDGFASTCLTLAILTNIAQDTEGAKERFRDKIIHPPSKPWQRSCKVSCRCEDRLTTFDVLLPFYLECSINRKETDMEALIFSGYAAILIGLLSLECQDNLNTVLEKLPGSTKQQKFSSIVTDINDFLRLHAISISNPNTDEVDEDTPSDNTTNVNTRDIEIANQVLEFVRQL
jgi:hypothetical protein